jgi:hypothetical protein
MEKPQEISGCACRLMAIFAQTARFFAVPPRATQGASQTNKLRLVSFFCDC